MAQIFIPIVIIDHREVDALVAHLNINISIKIDDIEKFFEVVSGDIPFFLNHADFVDFFDSLSFRCGAWRFCGFFKYFSHGFP